MSTPAGRVRLKATKVGVRWLIREADFNEFLANLTAASLPGPSVENPPVSSAKRSKEIAAATKKLDELLKTRR